MREPAWRILASEYNDAMHFVKSEGEKTPKYVITPLGAKVNRLYIVGVLTDLEEIGGEGIRRKARISDPTGSHIVYAETFEPEVASILADIQIPSYVAIVGKARIYEPEEGVLYVSARAEIAKEVNEETRKYWTLEACKNMAMRIDAMKEAMNMKNPSVANLVEIGYPSIIAEGIIEAIKLYKEIDIEHYEIILKETLSFITSKKLDIKKSLEGEEKIFKIIEEMQGNEGVSWEKVVEEGVKIGMGKESVEEIIFSLMEKGLVYEPQLGKLKLV